MWIISIKLCKLCEIRANDCIMWWIVRTHIPTQILFKSFFTWIHFISRNACVWKTCSSRKDCNLLLIVRRVSAKVLIQCFIKRVISFDLPVWQISLSNTAKMVLCYQNCSDLLWEKIVWWSRKTFDFWGWRPRIAKVLRSLEQFILAVKGQNNFW